MTRRAQKNHTYTHILRADTKRAIVTAYQQVRAMVLKSFKAYIPRLHRKSNRFRLVSEQPRDGYLSNLLKFKRYTAGMLA